jgi:hypothetical protein
MVWYYLPSKPIEKILDDNRCENEVPCQNSWCKPNGLWIYYNDEWKQIFEGREYIYKVTLKKNIKILKLDTLKKLLKFQKKYRTKYIYEYQNHINWKKVCKDYDAIFFTKFYEVLKNLHKSVDEIEFQKYEWYKYMDLNSACIFRPSLVVSKFIQIK